MSGEGLVAVGLLAGAVLVGHAARSGGSRRARGGTVNSRAPGPGSAHSEEWRQHVQAVRRSSGPWHVVRRTRDGQLVASGTHHSPDGALNEATMWRQSGRSAAVMPGQAPRTMSDGYEHRARSVLATVPARHRAMGGAVQPE